jgi:hypothetical protein
VGEGRGENANTLYTEFQRFSTLTPVTTQDIMEFGKGVAVSTFQAGGSIKDLTKITEQGVIAAKAFGYGTAYSALELSEMLAGNVNKRMMFAKQLLGMARVDEKEFNAMSGKDRVSLVEKTLNSDAMKNAAKAFGDSWSGVTSTLEDKLQILVGKVGLPLFKSLTKEVQSWNQWIDNNTAKIDAFGTKLADGLVTGFTVVKDAVSFMVDHADLLLTIGKVWAAVRIGGILSGGLGLLGAAGSGVRGAAGAIGAAGTGVELLANSLAQRVGLSLGLRAGAGVGSVAARGISFAGGMAGAAGSLGLGGMLGIGAGAYALSELSGLREGIHGFIDPTGAAFERLQKVTANLDDAMARASAHLTGKDGAAGSPLVKNMVGLADVQRQQAEILRDINGGRFEGSGGPFSKIGMLAKLRDSGLFDDDEIKRAMGGAGARSSMISDLGGKMGSLDARAGIMPGVYAGVVGATSTTLGAPLQKMVDLQSVNNDILQYIAHSLAAHEEVNSNVIRLMLIREAVEGALQNPRMAAKPNVNITIQRIEVQSDDPDRYAFGLVEAFRDAVKSPSQAVRQIRGG